MEPVYKKAAEPVTATTGLVIYLVCFSLCKGFGLGSQTDNTFLSPDSAVDLQTHTCLSDGQWTPRQLVEYFVSEGFALAAITDHDRVDTAAVLQKLSQETHFPLLVAAEMTTSWRGEMVDVLCFGFDSAYPALSELAQDVLRRQCDNTRAVYDRLCEAHYLPQYDVGELAAILSCPSAQQVHELQRLVSRHNRAGLPGKIISEAGFSFASSDIAAVVDAAHQSGAVALVAHPGRGGEFTCFDTDLLDQLRREVPIDGLENLPSPPQCRAGRFVSVVCGSKRAVGQRWL